MNDRLRKAEIARKKIERMQAFLTDLEQRSNEVIRDPTIDQPRFNFAVKHSREVLQTLWVYLHYLSHKIPSDPD